MTMMLVGFYESQLFVLAAYSICYLLLERLIFTRKRKGKATFSIGASVEEGRRSGETSGFPRLARTYLLVYAVVMGADWLQALYLSSLYHEQYEFPEHCVALLLVTGYTAAGLAAPLVGVWADRYGRRRVCLAFCATYAVACACALVPVFEVLLVGRVLAGVSATILLSCFEAWLVAAAAAAGVGGGGGGKAVDELSRLMGRASLVNGAVAAAAGVVGARLVGATRHSLQMPFVASGALLLLAWSMIRRSWGENYGSNGGDPHLFLLTRLRVAWRIVRQDASLWVLVLTQTCFEGSTYLFVFLWVPSLQEVAPSADPLPLGYIFSSFMVSMMLGSIFYTSIVSCPSPTAALDTSVTLHAKLSSLICTLAAISLLASVTTPDPRHRFWAFCVFEASVGMYYPVQGMLRSAIIPNEHRATLSALSRIPLNIFATVALITRIGEARSQVFGWCAAALVFSALMTFRVIVRRVEQMPLLRD